MVKPAQLAKALGVNRSTVCRNKAIYENGGPVALMIEKTNRSAYKLDRQKLQKAQSLLDKGINQNKIAVQLGVSEGCIRYVHRANESIAILKGMGTGSVARIMTIEFPSIIFKYCQ